MIQCSQAEHISKLDELEKMQQEEREKFHEIEENLRI